MERNILVDKYFCLTDRQKEQFEALFDLYSEWNGKINVISRKDIENLYLHHVLHSAAIAKSLFLKCNTEELSGLHFLDLGTGGGFPGIPLAILLPQCSFKLIDSIGKKIRVAKEIGDSIGLTNCEYSHLRGQEEKGRYDYVVSRAVMPLNGLWEIATKHYIHCKKGLICLKGGDLQEEMEECTKMGIKCYVSPVSDHFSEEWFENKYIVYAEH